MDGTGRKTIIIGLLFLLLNCTGCWDQIEIQQRAFVMGLGIDQISEQELLPSQIMEPGVPRLQSKQFLITMEIPKLQQIGGGQSGEGGGVSRVGGESREKPAWVPSITGVNLSHAIAEISIRAKRQVYLGHLRAVVIGDGLARQEGLRNMIDFLFRNPEIQREVPVFIANGQAKEVLAVQPPDEQLASIYLHNTIILNKTLSRFIYINLGDVATKLHENGNALIGRVRAEKEEAVVGGAAVIKNWKLVGYLGEVETIGARFLTNQIGHVEMPVQGPGQSWYGVFLYNARKEIKPFWDGKRLKLEYTISTESEIIEMPKNQSITSPIIDQQLNKAIERATRSMITATINTLQQEYQTDAFGVGSYIRRHRPAIWKKLGFQWNKEFPRVRIIVKIKNKNRRAGVTL